MNKRIIIIGIIAIAILSVVTIVGHTFLFTADDTIITDDYIVVFHGGASEVTYETYVYKKGFRYRYINTQTTNVSHKDKETVVLNVGKFNNIDDIYEIINDNGSNSYATLPNYNKQYSIKDIKNKLK